MPKLCTSPFNQSFQYTYPSSSLRRPVWWSGPDRSGGAASRPESHSCLPLPPPADRQRTDAAETIYNTSLCCLHQPTVDIQTQLKQYTTHHYVIMLAHGWHNIKTYVYKAPQIKNKNINFLMFPYCLFPIIWKQLTCINLYRIGSATFYNI